MRQLAPLALVLISAAMAVAAYLQALNYPFILDDIPCTIANKMLVELRSADLWRLLVEPYNTTHEFLPLRDFSYWIDIVLFGDNPAVFRLHNILLYLLCLPLIYVTTASLWRYFRPVDAANAPWIAATVTSLFALNPALIESVIWVSGRKYMLANFFSMLALLLAIRVKREHALSSPYALATLVAFVAVMFSKSSYVAIAPVIAMLWLIFWRDIPLPQRRRPLLLWPLAILLLAAFLLRLFIVKNNGFDSVPAYFGIEAVTRSLAVLGGLTRIAISPEARHFYHPVFEDAWLPAMVTTGGAVLCAAGWGGVTLMRNRSLAGFTMIVFLLLCIPYMQLIPAKPPSLVSDRYVSLAVWPAALLIVSLAWRFKPLPRTALLLVIALPWLFQTIERPRDWQNDATLIEPDHRAYPGYYLPAFYTTRDTQLPKGLYREANETANRITSPEIRNFMIKLIQADQAMHVNAVSTDNPNEVMALLKDMERMLESTPAQAKWDTPLAFTWLWLKEALATEWRFLAAKFPGDARVRNNAGAYMLHLRIYNEAVVHLRAATELQNLPKNERGVAFKNLGLAILGTGHITQAEAPLRMALEQHPPDLQGYCILSAIYRQRGQLEEAAGALAECRE